MKAIFFLLLLGLPAMLLGQISGVVTDAGGGPLAFVSVYLEGSTTGTVTNTDGQYSLPVPEGNHILVFRYIGYETVRTPVRVDAGNRSGTLDVIMQEQAIELAQVNVVADAEDPAYAIIRKAIEQREAWLTASRRYSCKAYMKSLYRFTETPERIMGVEMGDMGGVLDTNGQGIIYFSESESELFMDLPNRQKEIMHSSKVSGSDNAFSFNRASLMDMNFYKPALDLGRAIISPIANGAFFYYRYRLEGSFFDEKGRLINKIAVLPKRDEDPVFSGFIYIVEDLWNFQSVDLSLTGKNMKQPALDTLHLRQVYIPVEGPDRWMPFDQSLEFSVSILGFGFEGYVSTQFSEYEMDPDFPLDLFSGELFRIEEGANQRDSGFWGAVRPVPLTAEEVSDYSRKDSLKTIWESKPYMDSLDRESNRLTPTSLLSGHTWTNSWKRQAVTVESPLSTIAFNPVQGLFSSLRLRYRQAADREETAYFSGRAGLTWGFTDKQLRGELMLTRKLNDINFAAISISGGRKVSQLNGENPVNEFVNNMYALLARENYLKLYDKRFGKVDFSREVTNGVFVRTSLEYADRRGIVNASNYSFSKREGFYAWNDPFVEGIQEAEQEAPFFERSRAWIWETSLKIRFAQRYWSYPNRKVILGSLWPEFEIKYRKGLNLTGSDVNFDFLSVAVKGSLDLGLAGTSGYFFQGGAFLNARRPQEYIDWAHFRGNQMILASQGRQLGGFLWLPYYQYSTDDRFLQAHFEHHFNGFIFDKLPLLRKLGWSGVAGASALTTPGGHYWEVNIGAENIGIAWFRLLRVDVVFPMPSGRLDPARVVFSVGL